MKEGYLWNRKWAWILILIGLGILLSYFQLLSLKEGGEITVFSMLIVYLIGYIYGGKTGIFAAILFGAIKYFMAYPFILNVPELWDYVLGYGLLGVGGFFSEKKGGLYKGFLLAVILRYIEGVWNCTWFYYMPEKSLVDNIVYGLIYCIGYIGTEGALTMMVLALTKVREAINYVKYVATHEYEEDLDNF